MLVLGILPTCGRCLYVQHVFCGNAESLQEAGGWDLKEGNR